MQIMFDVSRLVNRGLHRTPTGIDRVDLAYAAHLTSGSRKVSFCYGDSSARLRVVAAPGVHKTRPGLEVVKTSDLADPRFLQLCDLLSRPAVHWPPSAGALRLAPPNAMRQPILERLTFALRSKPRGHGIPVDMNGVIYLHTSHFGLDNPGALDTPKKRGSKVVVMLHDLIPVDYPEYCRPGDAAKHHRRLVTIQEKADLVLVNSNYTMRRLQAWAQVQKCALPLIRVVPLGVSMRHQSRQGLEPPLAARDYFVTVGTIEGRKNHALLLKVWRRLAEKLGPDCPVLVIAGSRGWELEAASDLLERAVPLAGNVIEVNGLGDFALASLMAGARAVLQPSLVEGFSLPVAEAQSLHAPLIASDIDAHREIAAPTTLLIDPLDGPGWLRAIESMLHAGALKQSSPWRSLGQEDHVAAAMDAMDCLA